MTTDPKPVEVRAMIDSYGRLWGLEPGQDAADCSHVKPVNVVRHSPQSAEPLERVILRDTGCLGHEGIILERVQQPDKPPAATRSDEAELAGVYSHPATAESEPRHSMGCASLFDDSACNCGFETRRETYMLKQQLAAAKAEIERMKSERDEARVRADELNAEVERLVSTVASLKAYSSRAQARCDALRETVAAAESQRDEAQAEALKQAADAGKLEFQLRAWRVAAVDALRAGSPPAAQTDERDAPQSLSPDRQAGEPSAGAVTGENVTGTSGGLGEAPPISRDTTESRRPDKTPPQNTIAIADQLLEVFTSYESEGGWTPASDPEVYRRAIVRIVGKVFKMLADRLAKAEAAAVELRRCLGNLIPWTQDPDNCSPPHATEKGRENNRRMCDEAIKEACAHFPDGWVHQSLAEPQPKESEAKK